MGSRLEDFLKTCGVTETSADFLKTREDQVREIQETISFKKELQRHTALAHKNRLLIYHLIQKEELCNCALAKITGLTEGSVTHHIKKLEDSGLIVGRNKGHFIFYYTVEQMEKDLKKKSF